MPRPDSVVRAISDDGAFRLLAVRMDLTARAAIAAQQVSGNTARRFAEFLTGAVLFRETMAPQLRVQCAVHQHDRLYMLADAFPAGATRGLIRSADSGTPFDHTAAMHLRLSRTMPGGRIQEGIVEIPGLDDLSNAFMIYMQESEQVKSTLALATSGDGAGLRVGGYLVQLLPEVGRAALAVMTERLEQFPALARLLADDATPHDLLARLSADMPYTQLDQSPVLFQCTCSRKRAATTLSTVARSEVELACIEQRELVTTCEYCRSTYQFRLEELTAMLPLPTIH